MKAITVELVFAGQTERAVTQGGCWIDKKEQWRKVVVGQTERAMAQGGCSRILRRSRTSTTSPRCNNN